ncbi:MAG: MotA/TolQ/ExbB proton channel family protein, partial [Thermoguttaceae bacterium]|nr:MotA/TolQ/ExbB proton channel family protein [Thermoguttaceae bacterium]
MIDSITASRRVRWRGLVPRALRIGLLPLVLAGAALAQGADLPAQTAKTEAEKRAEEALRAPEPKAKEAPAPAAAPGEEAKLDYLELTFQGGPLMIPILFFSVLVVALAFERAIALRRGAVLPRKLVDGLKSLSNQDRGLDPREAYRLCQRCPSAAATVIRAMLMKVDRPMAEIEAIGREAAQREATRLSGGTRWLTLSAAVAPMLGLLGTVQGMILAFFRISHLPPGVSRAQELSGSIYIALVTTFAGLSVAIPAAVLAHLANGRLMR